MIKYLKITLLVLLFTGDIKENKRKKALKKKKSSENDQSTGHFQSLFIFFCPPDPRSEKKNHVNQLIKKIWP